MTGIYYVREVPVNDFRAAVEKLLESPTRGIPQAALSLLKAQLSIFELNKLLAHEAASQKSKGVTPADFYTMYATIAGMYHSLACARRPQPELQQLSSSSALPTAFGLAGKLYPGVFSEEVNALEWEARQEKCAAASYAMPSCHAGALYDDHDD